MKKRLKITNLDTICSYNEISMVATVTPKFIPGVKYRIKPQFGQKKELGTRLEILQVLVNWKKKKKSIGA